MGLTMEQDGTLAPKAASNRILALLLALNTNQLQQPKISMLVGERCI